MASSSRCVSSPSGTSHITAKRWLKLRMRPALSVTRMPSCVDSRVALSSARTIGQFVLGTALEAAVVHHDHEDRALPLQPDVADLAVETDTRLSSARKHPGVRLGHRRSPRTPPLARTPCPRGVAASSGRSRPCSDLASTPIIEPAAALAATMVRRAGSTSQTASLMPSMSAARRRQPRRGASPARPRPGSIAPRAGGHRHRRRRCRGTGGPSEPTS